MKRYLLLFPINPLSVLLFHFPRPETRQLSCPNLHHLPKRPPLRSKQPATAKVFIFLSVLFLSLTFECINIKLLPSLLSPALDLDRGLYGALVHPNLAFGMAACSPNLATCNNHLGRIQRYAPMLVTVVRHLPPKKRLQ